MKDNHHKKVWKQLFANEPGRLAQGAREIDKGTDTVFFINYYIIPSECCKDIKYGHMW